MDPEDLEQVTGKRIQLTSKDVDSTCNETLVTGNFEGLVFCYLSSLLFDLTQKEKMVFFPKTTRIYTSAAFDHLCQTHIPCTNSCDVISFNTKRGGGGTLDFK